MANSDAQFKDKSLFYSVLLTLALLALLIYHHSQTRPSVKFKTISGLQEQLPDFSQYSQVKLKKEAFFNYLSPFIQQENQRIRYDRAFLDSIKNNLGQSNDFHASPHQKLKRLAKRYRVDLKNIEAAIALLERRIDVIPESLVLVQAANESAWGTSRFAREANNLFGQWCYKKGCGIVPKFRDKNARHEVRRFNSPQESIVSYMRNLNTHPAYKNFRTIRQQLRESEAPISGLKLAEGLENYSERRGEYVAELQAMIRQNNLE